MAKSMFSKNKNMFMNLLIVVGLIFIAFALFSYNQSKTVVSDTMASTGSMNNPPSVYAPNNMPSPDMIGPDQRPMRSATLEPSDLLPSDANSEWSTIAPSGGMEGVPLLDPYDLIGKDTIGSSLRNPSYDLRTDPVIPVEYQGPWNQSTIERDPYRKPLE